MSEYGARVIRSLDEDDRRTVWVALATLIVFALLLRLTCITGLIGSDDDLKYSRYAYAITQGQFGQAVAAAKGHEMLHWSLRFGLLLPLAGIYTLFGVSEWSTIILPLVASTASVALVALIGRMLFNWRVGLVAGILYATFPLQLRYATILVPEPIAECWALVAIVLYLQGRRLRALDDRDYRAFLPWFVAAGLMFGAAYLAKESALFIGGAFLLHALIERRWVSLVCVGMGLFAMMAAEHTYYVVAHGDLMFRSHSTVLYDVDRVYAPNELNPNLGYRLFRYYPIRMLVPSLNFGLHSLLCLLGALVALRLKPRREYGLVLLWAIVPWLYLNFGSSSLQRYVVVPAGARYIEFTYPPLMILTAVVLAHMLSVRRTAMSAAAVLVIASLAGISSAMATKAQGYRTSEVAVLREMVRKTPVNSTTKFYVPDIYWRETLNILRRSIVSTTSDNAAVTLERDQLGLPTLPAAVPRASVIPPHAADSAADN